MYAPIVLNYAQCLCISSYAPLLEKSDWSNFYTCKKQGRYTLIEQSVCCSIRVTDCSINKNLSICSGSKRSFVITNQSEVMCVCVDLKFTVILLVETLHVVCNSKL